MAAEVTAPETTPAEEQPNNIFAIEATMPEDLYADAVEQPVAKTPEPEKPKHSSRQLTLAREFGIENAAAMDPKELEELIYDETRLQSRMAREARNRPQPEQRKPEPEPDEPFDLKEEDYEPAIWQRLKRAHDLEKKQKTTERELAEIKQSLQRREAQSFAEIVDSAFDSVNHKKLGVDEYDERQGRLRVLISQEAGLKAGDKPATIRRKIKAAAEAFFDITPDAAAAPEVELQVEDRTRDAKGRFTPQEWEEASTKRPTNRNQPELQPGVEKAVRALREQRNKIQADPELKIDTSKPLI